MGSVIEATEPLPGDPIFRLMERIECHDCLDTNIAITLYGPERCANCAGRGRRWSYPAIQLQECVFALKQKRRAVERQPLALARALTHFNSTQPLPLSHIVEYYKVTERNSKELIATIRNVWVLPVASHRQPPHGSYWITTAEEFLEWSRAYRAQAITSLATVYRLQRKHFPSLYGQGDLDFVKLLSDELQEELG